MAGHMEIINGQPCFLDYADGYGEAVINGRLWAWEFHEYLGPTFLKKNGDPRANTCPTVPAVWAAFNDWLKLYHQEKDKRLKKD